MTMMTLSVWTSFRSTAQSMKFAEQLQVRYAIVRNSLSRIAAELSMSYLSFNRPADEERHFTLFDGRDQFNRDSVTFSAVRPPAHAQGRQRERSVGDPVLRRARPDRRHPHPPLSPRGPAPDRRHPREDAGAVPRVHLLRGHQDLRRQVLGYQEARLGRRVADHQEGHAPDRLPERVKITLGIMDPNNEREIKYTVQTLLFMQEKLDFSK
jgi:general secretion pathway protein J